MNKMIDYDKIEILRELCNIPYNCGEQWINISLDIRNFSSGNIHFGFDWKMHIGEISFYSLDEAIEQVKSLRKSYPIAKKELE